MTTSPERMIAAFTGSAPVNGLIADTRLFERYVAMDSPYYENSEKFVTAFAKSDPRHLSLILFDHVMSDWRDVVRNKIHMPVAIFTGDYSANVRSQRWMQSVIADASLYIYSKEEQGDHFLMFKNPISSPAICASFSIADPTTQHIHLKEPTMPVVRVTWFEGKDTPTKQTVAAEITESIVRNTGTDPKYIYVIFEDVKPSDWAGEGKLYGG
jgi:phenylpyruvate tautomerase PptA (4-oxalocrotonate tautomerase family)